MSPEPNARKSDEQNGIKERTIESGLVRSGGKPDVVFSPPTQPVYRAMIKAACHTIPELTYMEPPNTLILRAPWRTASGVIEVFIGVDSSAENVRKLERNEKVNSAIDALLRRIRNELYFAESTGRESEMQTRSNGERDLKNG